MSVPECFRETPVPEGGVDELFPSLLPHPLPRVLRLENTGPVLRGPGRSLSHVPVSKTMSRTLTPVPVVPGK